jgi:hypothetical protein
MRRGQLTARKVPGKKNIVKTAMAFMAELSFLLSFAMIAEVLATWPLVIASLIAMNW